MQHYTERRRVILAIGKPRVSPFDEGTESAEVATSGYSCYKPGDKS